MSYNTILGVSTRFSDSLFILETCASPHVRPVADIVKSLIYFCKVFAFPQAWNVGRIK